MRALLLLVLMTYAVIVEQVARFLIDRFSTYLVFEAYHWPATLTWLAPAVFLVAGLSMLLLDGYAGLSRRDRRKGSMTPPADERERHGGWRHASGPDAAVMRVTTLVFLAMVVELGSWYALTRDLQGRVFALARASSDVGSSVILLVAAAWAVVELCRFLVPRDLAVTRNGRG